LPSTTSRSRGHTASFAGFGRRISRTARRPAAHARYRPGPPFAATSRHTVDGARPTPRAIARTDCPAARPREISSRSASDSLRTDRCGSRLAGRYSATTARRIACRDRLISRCSFHGGAPSATSSAIRRRPSSVIWSIQPPPTKIQLDAGRGVALIG
jgi:hypothetical protein